MTRPMMPAMASLATPARSYYADGIYRPDALVAGQRVTLLLGSEDTIGIDGEAVYLVTDQRDKKGNVLLINVNTGVAVYTSPTTVFANY